MGGPASAPPVGPARAHPMRVRAAWVPPPSMVPPLITVRGLHFVYPDRTGEAPPALAGIDLDIAPGECLAIIGGNGSGKSTLAKHLNALLLPTAGEVRVDGVDTRDPEGAWLARQRVGMVFEHPDNQIVAAVGGGGVAFGRGNLRRPAAERRALRGPAPQVARLEHHAVQPP